MESKRLQLKDKPLIARELRINEVKIKLELLQQQLEELSQTAEGQKWQSLKKDQLKVLAKLTSEFMAKFDAGDLNGMQ